MLSSNSRHPEEARSAVSKDATGVYSQIQSSAVPARRISLPALAAQIAGWAGAAAIAPIVPLRPVAVIAAVRFVADQLDQRRAAQFPRQYPGRRLVAPHQGGVDHKTVVHAE